MVASRSLDASVELARAIASMHTILRRGPLIASRLDDQRYALGDWRRGQLAGEPQPAEIVSARDLLARERVERQPHDPRTNGVPGGESGRQAISPRRARRATNAAADSAPSDVLRAKPTSNCTGRLAACSRMGGALPRSRGQNGSPS
jgi:hypothetical protein